MAEGDSSDLLMVVKPKGKVALEGEARAVVDQDDDMMQGFMALRGSRLYAEAEEFTFGAGIEDSDASSSQSSSSSGAQGNGSDPDADNSLHEPAEMVQPLVAEAMGQTPPGKEDKPAAPKPAGKHRKFKRFIEGRASWDSKTGFGYGVTLDEVTITRRMDRMSPRLLQLCGDQLGIDYLILVRRKSVGGTQAFNQQPFLRLKFSDVLLTAIDWDDGDVIKEKLKFVYRRIEAQYKSQKDDGTLGGAIGTTYEYPIENT